MQKVLKQGKRELFTATAFLVAVLLVLFFPDCARKVDPLSPQPGMDQPPPTPRNLTALVGDRTVKLSWEVSDSAILRFRIYRSDSAGGEVELVDSCAVMQFTDNGLLNGNSYLYQVSAVDSSGFEGYRSREVEAIPNAYGVLIEEGKEYVNSVRVSLNLVAPAGTEHVMLCEDSSFGGAVWLDFTATRSWYLTTGDGEKTVYAKFRDLRGNPTLSYYHDSIILDTKAIIQRVEENSQGAVLQVGDTLHLLLDSGETEGVATVDIGQLVTGISLYDDGTSGDSQSGDGLYQYDYLIPAGLEVEQEVVVGHFTDRVGNVASDLAATGTVTIRMPPDPVHLFEPYAPPESRGVLVLNWSRSDDEQFAFYGLYRSTSSGVDQNSTHVTSLEDPSLTTYTDSNLVEDVCYHYVVYVFDNQTLYSVSNEDSGRTGRNQPPEPSVLYQPYGENWWTLNICWSQNQDQDFANYQLFRAEESDFSDSLLTKTFAHQESTSFKDTTLLADSTYYYRVVTYDQGGLYSASSIVSGRTLQNSPPQPSILLTPRLMNSDSLVLVWSLNHENDFESYRLYRLDSGDTASVGDDDRLLMIQTDQDSGQFIDPDLTRGQAYSYRLYTHDRGGLKSGSNAVSYSLPPLRSKQSSLSR